MTDIETIVVTWLDKRNIQYAFQVPLLGGSTSMGGAVVDIVIPDLMLAWRIQGEYWHRGVEKEGSDLVQKELLIGLGYTVVDLWADDLLDVDRREDTLRKAMQGEGVI